MEYIIIPTDFALAISPLDDASRGRLFSAMLEYAKTGVEPELVGWEKFLWPSARLYVDRGKGEDHDNPD